MAMMLKIPVPAYAAQLKGTQSTNHPVIQYFAKSLTLLPMNLPCLKRSPMKNSAEKSKVQVMTAMTNQ